MKSWSPRLLLLASLSLAAGVLPAPTPSPIRPAGSAAAPAADIWATYRDDMYGFEFQYPKFCSLIQEEDRVWIGGVGLEVVDLEKRNLSEEYLRWALPGSKKVGERDLLTVYYAHYAESSFYAEDTFVPLGGSTYIRLTLSVLRSPGEGCFAREVYDRTLSALRTVGPAVASTPEIGFPATSGAATLPGPQTCLAIDEFVRAWPAQGIVTYTRDDRSLPQVPVDVRSVPLEQVRVAGINCGDGRGQGQEAYILYQVPAPAAIKNETKVDTLALLAAAHKAEGALVNLGVLAHPSVIPSINAMDNPLRFWDLSGDGRAEIILDYPVPFADATIVRIWSWEQGSYQEVFSDSLEDGIGGLIRARPYFQVLDGTPLMLWAVRLDCCPEWPNAYRWNGRTIRAVRGEDVPQLYDAFIASAQGTLGSPGVRLSRDDEVTLRILLGQTLRFQGRLSEARAEYEQAWALLGAPACLQPEEFARSWPPRGAVHYTPITRNGPRPPLTIDASEVGLERVRVMQVVCGDPRGHGQEPYVLYRIPSPPPFRSAGWTNWRVLLAGLHRAEGELVNLGVVTDLYPEPVSTRVDARILLPIDVEFQELTGDGRDEVVSIVYEAQHARIVAVWSWQEGSWEQVFRDYLGGRGPLFERVDGTPVMVMLTLVAGSTADGAYWPSFYRWDGRTISLVESDEYPQRLEPFINRARAMLQGEPEEGFFPHEEAGLRRWLGDALRIQGRVEEAREQYERAWAVYQQTAAPPRCADAAEAVRKHYEGRGTLEAYALLGEGLRRAQPFADYVLGFSHTRAVRLIEPPQAVGEDGEVAIVAVQVSAIDATPEGEVERRFAGTWRVRQVAQSCTLESADIGQE